MLPSKSLPDIASSRLASDHATLQWVGMEGIAVPLCLHSSETAVLAMADAFVSLDDADAKGIHMSRLHQLLNTTLSGQSLDRPTLVNLLDALVDSQQGISQNAMLSLAFDIALQKKALLSDKHGHQSYPIKLVMQRVKGVYKTELSLTITYSSTCPCSASLSRQLYAEAIDKQFSGSDHINKQDLLAWAQSEAASIATPHSQRSYAYLKLLLNDSELPDVNALIRQLESVIGTPVQTAVKRVDEQEFARLNAENLMFCEDVARRIKGALGHLDFVEGYWFKVEHQESLHAHNAVAIDQHNFV